MRVVFPYNEILPTKKAHDVFLFNECAALSEQAGVTLLIGYGSNQELFTHYGVRNQFSIKQLPILRKNFFNLSWNYPFFFATQKYLKKEKPNVVVLSVLKQARFHLERKLPGIKYVYEVHELKYYPGYSCGQSFEMEKKTLQKADLIVTTTEELAHILRNSPYSLKVPIVVIPLASGNSPLPSPKPCSPFKFAYVGQLYQGQGIPLLLKAFDQTPFHLKIIGGKDHEINRLKKDASPQVEFLGFQPPAKLPSLLEDVHAFIAPFEALDRMPYVAHTKLIEYIRSGRPIIAPDLKVVKECFPHDKGVIYFTPGCSKSLTHALIALQETPLYNRLLSESQQQASRFSWQERATKYFNTILLNP